jgi:SAM-dependent methyltransferase
MRVPKLRAATSGADQYQRVVLDRAVGAHLDALGPERLTCAEISGDGQRHRGWASFEALDYPAFDLCAPPADHGTYDVVVCQQVLEHVVDPFLAARTLADLAKPGGHVVVSTPFLIRPHELWGMQDYWRFTPRGLRTLLERADLVVDEVGTWGNRWVINTELTQWTARRRWLPLRDQPGRPVQVWAFARKLGSAAA